jgi:hypothetical protein
VFGNEGPMREEDGQGRADGEGSVLIGYRFLERRVGLGMMVAMWIKYGLTIMRLGLWGRGVGRWRKEGRKG